VLRKGGRPEREGRGKRRRGESRQWELVGEVGGGGGRDGGGRTRGWSFLSYQQFPEISSGRKIKPFLLAVCIPRRLSQRNLRRSHSSLP
jgi:hypothetical protein